MTRAVLFSLFGHVAVLGLLFLVTSGSAGRSEEARVYNVSIVPGITGSGGDAPIGITGMVGKPGKIGGPALPKPGSSSGASLVEDTRDGKKPGRKPGRDSSRAETPDQIALRVYGAGGTIGGGGSAGTGFGSSGRLATAFEIALNSKILPNWNENLWKALPERLMCTTQFLIHGDGAVERVEVLESSGNQSFDLAARRAIELARLPAPNAFGIPGEVHEARVTFVNRPE
jgi:TonB family protein